MDCHFLLPGGKKKLAGSVVKNPLAMQEMQVPLLSKGDFLGREMTTHSSILGWEIPWTEEPGGLQVHGGNKESDMTATKHARRCCE